MVKLSENNCQFVTEDNAGYLTWVRRIKNNKLIRAEQSDSKSSYASAEMRNIQRLLQKEYTLWEKTLRKVLSIHVTQFPNNILKFRKERGVNSYREIDFIVELGKSLLLCEIKARNHCDQNKRKLKIYKDGWKQVCRSHNIAKNNYSLLHPILIVVDMSYVFEIDYLPDEKRPDYVNITELEKHFDNLDQFISKDYFYREDPLSLLWLDSREIFNLSRENKFLQEEDVFRFRDLYVQSSSGDVQEQIFTYIKHNEVANSPFSDLKTLIYDKGAKSKKDKT
jgi:hypothetical protein